jgi:hypothetical protein
MDHSPILPNLFVGSYPKTADIGQLQSAGITGILNLRRGTQKTDKQVCQILDAEDRNFCEHCGFPYPGPVTCSNCGEFALIG